MILQVIDLNWFAEPAPAEPALKQKNIKHNFVMYEFEN